MKPLAAWLRRQLAWSNTRAAWAERAGWLALFAAGIGGWWLSRDWSAEARVVLLLLWLVLLALLLRGEIIRLLGPVFFYELLRGSRRRIHLIRTIYAVILLVAVVYVQFVVVETDRNATDSLSRQAAMAETFFLTFFGLQMLLVGVLTPVMVAGAIADEKERRTLEFVLATDLRSHEIVMGKLAARVAGMLLLLLAGLPVLSFLQFFGGISPEELLAAMLVTVVTLGSVATLSILMSVLMRRGRDAIVSTYVIMLAYAIISALTQALRSDVAGIGTSVGGWSLSASDLLNAFQAGNPLLGVGSILERNDAGSAYGEMLREVVHDYVVFHGLLGLLCLSWATVRLRPIALATAVVRRRWGRRPRRLRAVGSRPMIWKELFAERGPRLHLVLRLLIGLIVLASFWPAANAVIDYSGNLEIERILLLPFTNGDDGFGYAPRTRRLQRDINEWVRPMSGLVGSILLMLVALRGAGVITGERSRQTLDELLTTPLTNRDIIHGKWLGSLLGVRRGWLWLAAVYLIGFFSGGASLLGIVLAVAAWFAYAVFYASLGVWCSVNSRTTLQSTVLTILLAGIATVGHWLLTGLCCFLPMASGGGSGFESMFRLIVSFQIGLTPPAVLGIVPIRSVSELNETPMDFFFYVVVASLGPLIFLAVGLVLRASAVSRFAARYNRTDLRRPERLKPRADEPKTI